MIYILLVCFFNYSLSDLTMLCFQALIHGFLNFRNFDLLEYEHYEVSFWVLPELYAVWCACYFPKPAVAEAWDRVISCICDCVCVCLCDWLFVL